METKSGQIYEFRRISQKHNETFISFVERLQRQAAKCNFRFPEEHIFAQIIDKCKDSEFRNKALKNDFSFEELIAEGNKILCTRCGSKDHGFWNSNCEALNNNCLHCKKKGHFADFCRSKRNVSTERPPSRFSENVLEPSRNEMKSEPIMLQEAIENLSAKFSQNSEAVPQSPTTSFPSTTLNSPQEDPRIDLKRKRQDSLESCSSVDLQLVRNAKKFANPKSNAVIEEAAAALTPLVLPPTPKSYYDCFVGGKPMKLIVKTNCPINMIGKEQYQKLRNERFTHYHENELPAGFGDCIASFTVNITLGSESIGTNVFVNKENLDGFIYVSAKTAKKLKLPAIQ